MPDQQKRKDTKRDRKASDEYTFEQFRVLRGCLGYLVADPKTKLAAVVDPEAVGGAAASAYGDQVGLG